MVLIALNIALPPSYNTRSSDLCIQFIWHWDTARFRPKRMLPGMTQMGSIRNKAKQNAPESTTFVIAFPKKGYVKLSLCIYMYDIVHVHNNNNNTNNSNTNGPNGIFLRRWRPHVRRGLLPIIMLPHGTYVTILNFDSLRKPW